MAENHIGYAKLSFLKKLYKLQSFALKLSRNLCKTDIGELQDKSLKSKRLQSVFASTNLTS